MTQPPSKSDRSPGGAPDVSRLPPPGAGAAEHSARVLEHIRAAIDAAGGAISFGRFMELALYAPGLGYYSAGARKLGAAGDFVTAPEISPLFGRCLARQCAQVLAETGGDVLEFGAGSGALAADVLGELARLDALPARYAIVELSGELRERQRRALERRVPELAGRAEWLERLPERLTGVVLANEVLDAMPVERFRLRGGRVEQQQVVWDGDRLAARFVPAELAVAERVRALQAGRGRAFEDGYVSEVSLAHGPWVGAVADMLERGAVLLIDYGYPRGEYYHDQRRMGTLMCHYRHRAHPDPLILVGLQDITAHVDFTAVAEAAVGAGLTVAGFTTQAHFLIGCELEALAGESDPAEVSRHLDLARQVKTLTLPGEMGERFKVLGLARGLDLALMGFAVRDLRERL
ncbi:MAG: SAM-dependent methyltransferase [Gammaproteobacteria bacterium]|nr:SAM-dependent methyltransferase [Gammaproteobacteria bacterium]NIR98621.1 SAM-dependent methyltransferase [Gammaproteobacteria bacterium]NIT64344.1 SAM-dependent methyltransferase [Gammaproteobacteria bacterium]NIV21268.1 SAM-dependent methyltransferase [Gammaproteobacteria bacterium]NIX10972.1 SAM-dependent methyltransferase [Gammaproteobacteria bacterium]